VLNRLRAQPTNGEHDTQRIEAFSDGVIAIAITLLVLEVHVPSLAETDDGRELWSELVDLWPSYLGYLISFLTIGILWANHHDIFRYIARVDRNLVIINTLFLLTVAFLPFPTALLSEYLGHEGERTATIVYSGWFLVVALSYNLLWRYPSTNGRLLAPDADPAAVASISRRFNLGPPSYLIAFIAAFIYPPASLVILALLALIYVLPTTIAKR
jgi:uncharacterized membrane protein